VPLAPRHARPRSGTPARAFVRLPSRAQGPLPSGVNGGLRRQERPRGACHPMFRRAWCSGGSVRAFHASGMRSACQPFSPVSLCRIVCRSENRQPPRLMASAHLRGDAVHAQLCGVARSSVHVSTRQCAYAYREEAPSSAACSFSVYASSVRSTRMRRWQRQRATECLRCGAVGGGERLKAMVLKPVYAYA